MRCISIVLRLGFVFREVVSNTIGLSRTSEKNIYIYIWVSWHTCTRPTEKGIEYVFVQCRTHALNLVKSFVEPKQLSQSLSDHLLMWNVTNFENDFLEEAKVVLFCRTGHPRLIRNRSTDGFLCSLANVRFLTSLESTRHVLRLSTKWWPPTPYQVSSHWWIYFFFFFFFLHAACSSGEEEEVREIPTDGTKGKAWAEKSSCQCQKPFVPLLGTCLGCIDRGMQAVRIAHGPRESWG